MKAHTLFDRESGEILRTVYLPDGRDPKPKPGKAYISGDHSGETHFAPNGKIEARPLLDLSISGAMVSGIPHGAVVCTNGFPLPEGTTEFTATSPVEGSEVEVTVDLWPYQTRRFTVEAEQEPQEES